MMEFVIFPQALDSQIIGRKLIILNNYNIKKCGTMRKISIFLEACGLLHLYQVVNLMG